MNWRIKVIKTEEDHDEALAYLESLLDKKPERDSPEGELIELVSTLIKNYEDSSCQIDSPSAIDAIRFRMEQLSLKPVDLVPYIGSASRVSEILSGKRSLTVNMIKELSEGLNMPAKSLVNNNTSPIKTAFSNWSAKLIRQMKERGYFGENITSSVSEVLSGFFGDERSLESFAAAYRKSDHRLSPATDPYALIAWLKKVQGEANTIKTSTEYNPTVLTKDYLVNIVKLSENENDGPLLAQEQLLKAGIVLVIEPHLDKTRLDGALILTNPKKPIIGLTLRYDRIDNFWFTLMHELAHLYLHFDTIIGRNSYIFDELEEIKTQEVTIIEKEADELACETLVPQQFWINSPAYSVPSALAAYSLAKSLGIHPAIVAGKMRREGGRWKYLSSMVNIPVRKLFTNIKW